MRQWNRLKLLLIVCVFFMIQLCTADYVNTTLAEINQTTHANNDLLNTINQTSTDIKEDNEMISVSVLVIGFMFFCIFVGSQVTVKDKKTDELIPLHQLLKMIFYALAFFTSLIAIIIAYATSQAYNLNAGIDSVIRVLYMVSIWAFIITLFILLFVGMINCGWMAYTYLKKRGSGRSR